MHASSEGGEADSEHTDVAVIPHGSLLVSRYVNRTTVEAWRRKA